MFHVEHSILTNQVFVLVLISLGVIPVEGWCHPRFGHGYLFSQQPLSGANTLGRASVPRGTHKQATRFFRGQDTGGFPKIELGRTDQAKRPEFFFIFAICSISTML